MNRQARRHPDRAAIEDKAQRIAAEIFSLRVALAAASFIMADLRGRLTDPTDIERVDRFLEAHPAPEREVNHAAR